MLEITDLAVGFTLGERRLSAVRQVSFAISAGECVGIVGESGSGKTQIFMAALGLLPGNATATGSVRFGGQELLGLDTSRLNRLRGVQLAMIFQDPMSALTPHVRIGIQLAEVLVEHQGMSWSAARAAAGAMLARTGITDPERRLGQYAHELSGGMRQRVMIGMSLLCRPALIIADEPTTALDATVQAQIIELLQSMRLEFGTAVAFISHDLALVAGIADRILVVYAGRIVEAADREQFFEAPLHPYSADLIHCIPNWSIPRRDRLFSIEGQPPGAAEETRGCAYAPRCAGAQRRCHEERPLLRAAGTGREVACHYPRERPLHE